MVLLVSARQRCRNPKNRDYDEYGGRGIACEVTLAEMETLWKRDKADKLRRPSLDRVDPAYGYVLWNLRIIEFQENRMRALQGK